MRALLFLISCIFLLCSCGPKTIYSKKVDFNQGSWNYDQVANFEFSIIDTVTVYDLVLNINHDIDFSNQNFYVKFYTKAPSQKVIEDVVSMELANQYGQWNGNCGSSNCEVEILLQGKTKFKALGEYSIDIEQFNRNENLKSINSIELKLIEIQS